jgi:hypothetical protein
LTEYFLALLLIKYKSLLDSILHPEHIHPRIHSLLFLFQHAAGLRWPSPPGVSPSGLLTIPLLLRVPASQKFKHPALAILTAVHERPEQIGIQLP